MLLREDEPPATITEFFRSMINKFDYIDFISDINQCLPEYVLIWWDKICYRDLLEIYKDIWEYILSTK